MRILSAKVKDFHRQQQEAEYNSHKKAQLGDGNRGGDKIRTYNFIKSRAVDHRTNKKTSNVRDVIEKGRFDLLID